MEGGVFFFKKAIMELFNGLPNNKNFEIVMAVRDKEGKPTGKKKAFSSDNASDLSKFVQDNSPRKGKRKKNRKKKNHKKNEGNS